MTGSPVRAGHFRVPGNHWTIRDAISLLIGVYSLSFSAVFSGEQGRDSMVFVTSRIPRTIALILAGASMSVAGLIMQMLARNKFVEPSTAGTVESARLGILTVTMLAPVDADDRQDARGIRLCAGRHRPLPAHPEPDPAAVAAGGAVDRDHARWRDLLDHGLLRPTANDLLQSLASWTTGDFSGVIKGRYELLWIAAALTTAAAFAADRFTVAGMGEDFTTNLGLNYRRVVALGLAIVAMVTAVDVVTVGAIPFLGLIVPNLVSMTMGDNVRKAIPWVAVGGAGFVLACDIVGRTIRYPFEIPIGVVVGIVGSVVFLYLLLGRSTRVG